MHFGLRFFLLVVTTHQSVKLAHLPLLQHTIEVQPVGKRARHFSRWRKKSCIKVPINHSDAVGVNESNRLSPWK